MLKLALAAALVIALSPLSAQAKNYQQVVCDNEPDPEQCQRIHYWYLQAIQPAPSTTSCCGIGDAYWIDIDRVTNLGVFATVADTRDCEYNKKDEGCITSRVP